MNLVLTQKERSLLQDQKRHEEVCIRKYSTYAQQAQGPALKELFSQYAAQEKNHYDTVDQLLHGQRPNLSGNQGGQQHGSQGKDQTPTVAGQQDLLFCNDMLMTETYISGAYDYAIFQTNNPAVRQALQHIQEEEQQHGEGLANYMQQHLT